MINVNVRGRMGNQMFIYSFARALQITTGQSITFNYYSHKKHFKEFSNDIKEFSIPQNIFFEENKKLPWYANTDNIIIKLIRHFLPETTIKIQRRNNTFIWLGEQYKEFHFNTDKDIFIDGYWQCSKYFDFCKEQIKKELIGNIKLSEQCTELYKSIKKTNSSVCVSIRRGDYIADKKIKKKYYVCDEEYLKKSINKMKSLLKECSWIVFSDDIEWVKQNVEFEGNVYYQPKIILPIESILLMSICKHYIISNSSFSWWGQYLSDNQNKIVVGPNKWYVDGRQADIIEDSWIQIEV